MINYLLGLIWFTALGLSIICESQSLIYFTVAFVVIWFVCLLIDVIKIKAELKSSDFANSDGFYFDHDDYYTSLIAELGLQIIKKRNQLLARQAEINQALNLSQQKGVVRNLQIELKNLLSNLGDENSLFQGLLKLYQNCSKAQAIVISVRESKQVYSHYISYEEVPAFRSLLDEYAEFILEKDEQEQKDLLSDSEVFERQFVAYGFNNFYVRMFTVQNRLCLIWAGYREEHKPDPKTLMQMQKFIDELKEELKSNSKLLSLTVAVDQAQHSQNLNTDYIVHLSHDIRSPLNNVKSILHLIEATAQSADDRELINSAIENCKQVNEIVTELLEFSKLNSGNLSAKKHVFNLVACVKQIVSAYKIAAKAKGLDLQILAPDILVTEADKGQIKRVLQNLISNAIKYTDYGHIQVVVRAISDGRLGLKVMDTGRGLKPEQVKALFVPFKRFHTDVADGIGLGLVLTKALIELNGGEIKVVSNEKQGTTFSITLPASKQAISFAEQVHEEQECLTLNAAGGELEEEFINRHANSAGKRILVLDDDHEYVKTLARSLEHEGYIVFQAFSVDQALSIFNYEQPDYIVSDQDVATGGAKRLLDFVVNAYEPKPVYILTGNTDRNLHQKLIASGATKVFIKPVELNDLIAEFSDDEKFDLAV
jgi:signal transduction histidine kinase/ActR/RegA family two-component response regulator